VRRLQDNRRLKIKNVLRPKQEKAASTLAELLVIQRIVVRLPNQRDVDMAMHAQASKLPAKEGNAIEKSLIARLSKRVIFDGKNYVFIIRITADKPCHSGPMIRVIGSGNWFHLLGPVTPDESR